MFREIYGVEVEFRTTEDFPSTRSILILGIGGEVLDPPIKVRIGHGDWHSLVFRTKEKKNG